MASSTTTAGAAVSVDGVEERVVGGKDVTVFHVTATQGDISKAFWKTLEEFQELDKWVIKFHRDSKNLPHVFQPYLIRQHFIDKNELNNSRMQKLNDYIQALLALPPLFASFPVQYFLRLHDLRGKVIIVTGANTGIGKVAARDLAEMGAHVILACRSKDKTQPVVSEISQLTGSDKVEFMELDLGSLASVRSFASAFLSRNLPLHVLLNNAGLAGAPNPLTVDGFEVHLGVNHLGMFLLTELLKSKLVASAPSRVIIVSSIGHEQVKITDLDWTAARQPGSKMNALKKYQISKLANSLYATELAEELKDSNVAVFHTHPGAVKTDVWRALPGIVVSMLGTLMIGVEEGALTSILLAAHPGMEARTGKYFNQCIEMKPNPAVLEKEHRVKCIQESRKLVGLDAAAAAAAAAAGGGGGEPAPAPVAAAADGAGGGD